MKSMKCALPLLVAIAYCPAPGWAAPLMGTDLADFAVLGASAVANTGPTTVAGNLGVSPGGVITGFFGTVANEGPGIVTGTSHQADAIAASAQAQLTNAITSLGLMGPGTLLGSDLSGLTLFPGVYTVLAGTSNLTGTLILDGLGNPNAGWVFQMPSTLITSAGSFVDVINTGAGAGLFWNVGSSATIGAATSFEGNILAGASITLGGGASIACGRGLAGTGAVALNTNTVSTGCTGTRLAGSNGLSGGLTIPAGGGTPTFLPFTPVPEPATFVLLGCGLAGLLAFRKKLLPVA